MFSAEDGPAFARAANREAEEAVHPLLAFALPKIGKGGFMYGGKGPISDWTAQDLSAIRAINLRAKATAPFPSTHKATIITTCSGRN